MSLFRTREIIITLFMTLLSWNANIIRHIGLNAVLTSGGLPLKDFCVSPFPMYHVLYAYIQVYIISLRAYSERYYLALTSKDSH